MVEEVVEQAVDFGMNIPFARVFQSHKTWRVSKLKSGSFVTDNNDDLFVLVELTFKLENGFGVDLACATNRVHKDWSRT